MRIEILEPALAGDLDGIFISLCHDATPIFCRFGPLRASLEPFARYLVKDKLTLQWRTVNYHEYISINGRHASTTCGVLDLFGVQMGIHWDGGNV